MLRNIHIITYIVSLEHIYLVLQQLIQDQLIRINMVLLFFTSSIGECQSERRITRINCKLTWLLELNLTCSSVTQPNESIIVNVLKHRTGGSLHHIQYISFIQALCFPVAPHPSRLFAFFLAFRQLRISISAISWQQVRIFCSSVPSESWE